MNRRTYAWLLGFALLGLVASASSTYIHYRINQDPSYTSICSVNQILNCESAYTSRYGTIRGVSVALVGLIWFSLVVLLLSVVRLKPDATAEAAGTAQDDVGGNVAAYMYTMSTLGLGVVIYFAYASFFILKTVCVFCLATYVAMIGLFICRAAPSEASLGSMPTRLRRDLGRLVQKPTRAGVDTWYSSSHPVAALAWFPVMQTDRHRRKRSRPLPDQVSSNQQVEFDRWFSSEPRTDTADIVRWCESPHRQVQRLSVSVVCRGLFPTQDCPGEVPEAAPRCGQVRQRRLSAGPRMQPRRLDRDSSRGVCGRRGRAARSRPWQGRGHGGVALLAPAGPDARRRTAGGCRSRRYHRFRPRI